MIRQVVRPIEPLRRVFFVDKGGRRNEAGQVAIYLIRELCNKSLKEIA